MPSLFESISFSGNFAALGPEFSTPQHPTALPEPYLIATSPPAMALCGISQQQADTKEFVELFTGNQLAQHCEPRAAVYSGHQFGQWAGQLGDGRAILLGDLNGYEIQLKGSGLTPYSRMGDGRAVLRSSVREFLCSEAMAGLGIPTTRALCITGSPFMIMREQPESTAVVTRIAPSFVRFGSFEHWYYRRNIDSLKTLADYVIQHYFPEIPNQPNRYATLLAEVTKRTAHLIAQWQTTGFMHGVLNTDNMSVLGLTLDYGPFGFMEAFNPHHICNHSDDLGRYSYAMQPQIGQWNCHALGQALLPLIGSVEETTSALSGYQQHYQTKLAALWRAKLGLTTSRDEDDELIQSMLAMMEINGLDFTLFFRRLCGIKSDEDSADHEISDLCIDRNTFNDWMKQYRLRLTLENRLDDERQLQMKRSNPKFILRNYLAQNAIDAAQRHDFSEIEKLRQILSQPFAEQPEHESYAALPPDWASELSVSCSS
jgi:uncharacterized protein YdiU (UPF0061 family)